MCFLINNFFLSPNSTHNSQCCEYYYKRTSQKGESIKTRPKMGYLPKRRAGRLCIKTPVPRDPGPIFSTSTLLVVTSPSVRNNTKRQPSISPTNIRQPHPHHLRGLQRIGPMRIIHEIIKGTALAMSSPFKP